MKKQDQQQNFELIFIKPVKVKASKANKNGTRNLLVYLNNQTVISLSQNFITAVFKQNKKPQ